MSLKTNRWSFDTCGCVVRYSWETTDAPSDRVHAFTDVEITCVEHSDKVGIVLYNAAVDENQRKNITQGVAQGIQANLTRDVYVWSFDASRVLLVSFDDSVSVNNPTKASIQSACDLQFGPNKVRVG